MIKNLMHRWKHRKRVWGSEVKIGAHPAQVEGLRVNVARITEMITDGTISESGGGLCGIFYDVGIRLNTEVFREWAFFSGDTRYPVQSTSHLMTPKQAYSRLPRWGGEYGEDRMLLAHFLVYRLREDLEIVEEANA